MGSKIIASFKSRSQMMSFDTALRHTGAETEIIPTPKAIALGCGLSVQFDTLDMQAAKAIIKATDPTAFEGFYQVNKENGRIKVIKMFE